MAKKKATRKTPSGDSRQAKAAPKKAPAELMIPIAWPTDLQAVYANNLLVQNDEGVLILSFFQVNPPYLTADSVEQRQEALANLGSLKAIPAAKLVIPLDRIPKIIEVIQQRWEKGKQGFEDAEHEGEAD